MRLNWGTGIAAVYAAFALSTVGFVLFAMGHPVDLVANDYYLQSLGYDQRMAGERNAQALGDRLRAALAPAGDGQVLSVDLPAEWRGRASGAVTLYRPSNSGADRSWPLALDGDGRQSIPVAGLVAGHWRLKLVWQVDGRPYYHEQIVDVPR